MTMTEPSPQIAKEPINSKTISGVENSETHLQEVNNDVTLHSGGVSNDGNELENCCQNEKSSAEISENNEAVKKSKGRNVKFPEGGFVAGYNEPKDPWKDAEKWTTEELVSAYRKSCEKHGTKPLPRLLLQLQKISCNGKRHDSLILKGEKLDQKHCECLEEVFRRVQFRHVDLEASHLDDECAVALFDMIEYYCSACHLNISFNKNISMRGWQSCSRLIRRTPSLTILDMRNCDLNERSIPIMGRALKLGSHLTILHLENIYLSGRPLVILVAALKMNENLLELFLADNKLMPSDGIQLGIMMKYNHKLELMDLRNNHLQDVGTRHLCDGLCEQTQDRGLLTLVLWNNQITYQGMMSLANCLMVVMNLETLNLGHNSITNEGIHQLKEGLLKNKSLLRLGLQGTKITCEGAVALAEYVADSSKLLRLDLRENDIKTAGLMGLSLALRMNETVTRIDLDKDTKKESGVKDYADQQRRLQQEIVWYQERNQVRVLEREEEDRRRLEERAQREADLRQAAETLKETESTDDAMTYIPSMDKIQRPKLLFSNDQTPQQTLESPDSMINAQATPEKPSVTMHQSGVVTSPPSFLSPPPADLLLSPQYCPDLTAKKIFTVSRVNDNCQKNTGLQTIESPTSCVDVSPSLHEQHLIMSPAGTLCENVASETMNEYIEQIVLEANRDEAELTRKSSINTNNVDCSVGRGDTEDSGLASQDNNNRLCSNNIANVASNKELAEASVNNECDKVVSITSDHLPKSESQDNVILDSVPCSFASENGKSVQLTGSIVAKLSDMPEEEHSSLTFDMLNSLENTKHSDSDINTLAKDKNLNFEKTLESSLEREREKELKSKQRTDNMDSLSGGPDQWLKIDSLDLVQQNKLNAKSVSDKSKPDFHTNYTLNGLTEELASALDISEEPADPAILDDKIETAATPASQHHDTASGDHNNTSDDKLQL